MSCPLVPKIILVLNFTPREVVGIGMELDKDLHPEHLMELTGEEDWSMDATLMGVYNVLWETEKEKAHGRPRSFPPFDCSEIVFYSSIKAPFIISCAFPSFRKSQDEISFKGESCNTPCY
jgi:hypothetical protein